MTVHLRIVLLVMTALPFLAAPIASLAQNGRPLSRTSSMPLNDCRSMPTDPRYARSQALVDRVFRRVAAASPEVFTGDMSPDRFCFRVTGGIVGGRASQLTLGVTIGPDIIDRVQNESQLAWLIAHEAAHHTMVQTRDGNPLPGGQGIALSAKRRRKQEIIVLQAQLQDAHVAKTDPRYVALQSELDRLEREMAQALRNVMSHEAAANWDEAEADRVGLRFYLRAGYDRTEIGWRHEQTVIALAAGSHPHAPPPNLTSIERETAAARHCNLRVGSAAPARGIAKYPSDCWSLWDLKFNQRAESSDLETLYARAPRTYLGVVDELRAAQTEVRASDCIASPPCREPGAPPLPSEKTSGRSNRGAQ